MAGIVAVLVLVSLSLIVTRVGSAALEATGLSPDLARFQARSAFTGVGYTTGEAESVARHPVRRRIVMLLMLLGNAGLVSVVASLVLSFSGTGGRAAVLRLGVLLGGLVVLFVITRMPAFEEIVKRGVRMAARRWAGLDVRDYVELLDVSEGYAIHDVTVDAEDWLADTALRDLDLPAEGVLVLGIRDADGQFLGAPRPDTRIDPGDTVVLYGREDALQQLHDRERGGEGDVEHDRSAREHGRVQEEERSRRERSRRESR